MLMSFSASLGMRRAPYKKIHGRRWYVPLQSSLAPRFVHNLCPLAVAMLALIKSETKAFPLSTVIIEQYRPPIDAFVVGASSCYPFRSIFSVPCVISANVSTELPAGLIDEGESAEDAAMRELVEETGFKAERIIESSPVIVSDPGAFSFLSFLRWCSLRSS